jgi:hypothetical protein
MAASGQGHNFIEQLSAIPGAAAGVKLARVPLVVSAASVNWDTSSSPRRIDERPVHSSFVVWENAIGQKAFNHAMDVC